MKGDGLNSYLFVIRIEEEGKIEKGGDGNCFII